MNVDDLTSSLNQISLDDNHRPRSFRLPSFNSDCDEDSNELDGMQGNANESNQAPIYSSSSGDSTRLMPDLDEHDSATSSYFTALMHPSTSPKFAEDPPLRRGGSTSRRGTAVASELSSFFWAACAPVIAVLWKTHAFATGLAIIAALAQCVALIRLSSCQIFLRRRRRNEFGSDRAVRFPRYWWVTNTEGLLWRLLLLSILVLLRVAILTFCVGAIFMRLDGKWGAKTRDHVRILGETAFITIREAGRSFTGQYGSDSRGARFSRTAVDGLVGFCTRAEMMGLEPMLC